MTILTKIKGAFAPFFFSPGRLRRPRPEFRIYELFVNFLLTFLAPLGRPHFPDTRAHSQFVYKSFTVCLWLFLLTCDIIIMSRGEPWTANTTKHRGNRNRNELKSNRTHNTVANECAKNLCVEVRLRVVPQANKAEK